MHNNQNVVTAGICVGPILESKPIQSKCTRGGDKKACTTLLCKVQKVVPAIEEVQRHRQWWGYYLQFS